MLVILATVILVSGICLIREMGQPLAKGRDRLSELRKYFDEEVSLRAYSAGGDPKIALQRSSEKVSLEWFFYGVLGLGYAFTVWLLFRVACA